MREVEVKILGIDKNEIEKKILALGGEKIGEDILVDRFFDFPDKRLYQGKEFLRVRKSKNKNEIVFKEKKESSRSFKIKNEIQTSVTDPDVMAQIIEKLGFILYRHTEKKRTSYKLGNANLEIDEYPGVPAFLEFEAEMESDVEDAVEKMGFKMEDTTSRNGRQILLDYGIDSDFIKF